MNPDRKREVLKIYPRLFIADKGWLENVEVRIEWQEQSLGYGLPPKAGPFFVRAYHGNKIVQHIYEPYQTLRKAKNGAARFMKTLDAYSNRARSREEAAEARDREQEEHRAWRDRVAS